VTGFLVRRLLITAVLIWLVTTVVFMFVRLLPGDPASAILGASESFQPTEAALVTVRQRLGLDRPVPEQYLTYIGGLLRGDLGESLTSGRPVTLDLRLRLGRTLQLMVPALLLSSFLGIAIGVLAARARGRILDPILSVIGLVGFSVPVFVIGNVMVLILAIQLEWLPSSGYIDFTQDPVRSLRYMVMPTIALALAPLAVTMRMTRTTVVEELGLDYVRTARAKGLGERILIYRHVLKNAMLRSSRSSGCRWALPSRGRSSSSTCSTGPASDGCFCRLSTRATIRSSRGRCCCSRRSSFSSTSPRISPTPT